LNSTECLIEQRFTIYHPSIQAQQDTKYEPLKKLYKVRFR